jgi:MOSC domain-containing protein YiiM
MSKQGHIFQICVAEGGVPKYGIHSGELNEQGFTEDRVGHPKKQGGEAHAVCIFSLEKILALQKEGHPIFPGSCGENLDLAGIDWEDIHIGTRLELGSGVLLEVTQFTKPCASVSGSFLNGDIARIMQESHPGWSRVYARVLTPGRVKIGDTVRILD